MPNILASKSPARQDLLKSVGIEFDTIPSEVDEDLVLQQLKDEFPESNGDISPSVVVLALSSAKAQAVYDKFAISHTKIIGVDTVFVFEGEIWGKPDSVEDARAKLRRMQGNSGTIYTGHSVLKVSGDSVSTNAKVDTTEVYFAPMSDEDIEWYLSTGEPLVAAGNFKIDGAGGMFISRIEGNYHNVVGMNLCLLREMLG